MKLKSMIAQEQKPIAEALEYLDGKEKIVIAGSGGCDTVFCTGGESEVEDMADMLPDRVYCSKNQSATEYH